LLILGEHSRSFRSLWKLTEELELCDYVKFLNFVPTADLPYFYNGAEIFVYPSLYEGFGLPPIEAMACGVPVITSNASSLSEVVGDAALTVNPYDTLQLAETILSVLAREDLASSLKEKGLRHSSKYTWKANALRMLEIYRMVAAESPIISTL
jgi:glycosyltransferase involved in cell wall biosynthesis